MTRVHEACTRSPTRASLELQVPQKTVCNILRKRLRMFPYRCAVFGDESTFHISGTVSKHNVRMWGTEKPRAVVERVRDSLKVNVFCVVSRKKVYPCKLFKPCKYLGHAIETLLSVKL
ncbi:hypothetical protein B7P43_G00430 [Cryptotermes secundus]|uniref:Uncharacterized protein n=1 Tax=Cryptotermes secundus TaxID=105785 RepID=A0A2J7R8K3_9NEOP|nr:hypothetical protein B7P43_G00430 [Cryptotermes secundus]